MLYIMLTYLMDDCSADPDPGNSTGTDTVPVNSTTCTDTDPGNSILGVLTVILVRVRD